MKNARMASAEQISTLGDSPVINSISLFPQDKWSCECIGTVRSTSDQLAKLSEGARKKLTEQIGVLRCPLATRPGYRRYIVYCVDCGAKVAEVSATDDKLENYCDLHYAYALVKEVETRTVKQTDPKKKPKKEKLTSAWWRGCATINVSPVDGKLGFECFCGNDTRDFRNSKTLPPREIQMRLARREFCKRDSGFVATREE